MEIVEVLRPFNKVRAKASVNQQKESNDRDNAFPMQRSQSNTCFYAIVFPYHAFNKFCFKRVTIIYYCSKHLLFFRVKLLTMLSKTFSPAYSFLELCMGEKIVYANTEGV